MGKGLILLIFAFMAVSSAAEPWETKLREARMRNDPALFREVLAAVQDAMRDPGFAARPAVRQAVLLHSQAVSYYNLGEYREAKQHAVKTVKIFEAAGDEYLGAQTVSQATLGLICASLGELFNADRAYRAVRDTIPRWRTDITPDAADAWAQAGWFFESQQQDKEAEKIYLRVIEMAQKAGKPQLAAWHMLELSQVYARQKKLAEAEKLARLALQYVEGQAADRPGAQTRLAAVLHKRNQTAEAILLTADAITAMRRLPEPPLVLASALQMMGVMRAQFRQYDEAIASFEEALLILRKTYPADSTSVLACLQDYCAVLEKAGRKEDARRVREMLRAGTESWRIQAPSQQTVEAPEMAPAGV